MKKVIIIEDSPTFCNMLGKKLEAKGWKTILCYNYRDGLKAVRESWLSGNLVGISINLCKSIQKELFINDTP